MFGLTPLGAVHTLISLLALGSALLALGRHQAIAWRSRLGRWYVGSTVLTCLTGFGIFQHGGFGVPHALGVLTLLVLAASAAAEYAGWFGRAARYVATLGLSLTVFFHLIPGVTETFTRVPAGTPLFTGPDDPALQKLVGLLFLLFLLGAGWQVRRLRAGRGGTTPVAATGRVV